MKAWTREEIRAFRESLNLKQEDFGSLIGVTRRYVIYLEGGEKGAGETLKRLLDCLEEKYTGKKKGRR